MSWRPREALPLLAAVLAGTAALAGCAVTSPGLHDDLEAARADYERGRNDPLVVRNAWDDLEDARRTLARADAAWADRRDAGETTRLAAVASRKARAAVEAAALEDEADDNRARGPALTPALPWPVPVQALLFEPGQSELPPAAWRTLARLTQVLQQAPQQRLVVIGHADASGPASVNHRLAQARAEAVRQALVARGIAPDRVLVEARGDHLPVASNRTAAGRAMNRRVELAFPTATAQ